MDTVGIEPTTSGLQGQIAPLVHGCPLLWTDGESNSDLCRAKAACSRYHYRPEIRILIEGVTGFEPVFLA